MDFIIEDFWGFSRIVLVLSIKRVSSKERRT